MDDCEVSPVGIYFTRIFSNPRHSILYIFYSQTNRDSSCSTEMARHEQLTVSGFNIFNKILKKISR